MDLSVELKVPLEEILTWEVGKLYDWMAYFDLLPERRSKRRAGKAIR